MTLTADVRDYRKAMGITSNVLEYSYYTWSGIPRILGLYASACVAAAQIDPKSCPLAAASMKATDTAQDVLDRINRVVGNLTNKSFYDSHTNETYSFIDALSVVYALYTATYWNEGAQDLLDIETVITIFDKRSEE